MNPTVLNPVKNLTLQGQAVEVREFKALVLLALLKQVSAHTKTLQNEKGDLALTTANLGEVIIAVEGLFEEVALQATGKDKAWLETLTTSEALDLLGAVVELNKEVLTKKFSALGEAWRGTATPIATPTASSPG